LIFHLAGRDNLRYANQMSSIGFDTHAAASRYRAAGFTDPQVEALVDTAREVTGLPDISSLATKSDLAQLEGRLDGRIDRLDGKIDRVQAELKTTIASTQTQTIAIILAAMAALTAFSTLAPKLIH
jgi:hypothetical protein